MPEDDVMMALSDLSMQVGDLDRGSIIVRFDKTWVLRRGYVLEGEVDDALPDDLLERLALHLELSRASMNFAIPGAARGSFMVFLTDVGKATAEFCRLSGRPIGERYNGVPELAMLVATLAWRAVKADPALVVVLNAR